MKYKLLILMMCFAGWRLFAQVGSLSPVVIGSCGGYSTTTNFSISSNTGEVMVRTTSAPTMTLTQGFEQPASGMNDTAGNCGVVLYHGVTANGDGHNDEWIIDYIDLHPDNNVEIYNRWGALVWKTANYDNGVGGDGNAVWRGNDKNGNVLPDGTYFFIFTADGCVDKVKGWIELSH